MTMAHTRLSPLRIAQYLIVLGMFAAAAILYPQLPALVPTHWNFAGQADQFSGKAFGTWLLPVITLLMAILFPVFRRIDPKSENYEAFAHTWNVLQLCFTAFFAYVFGIQMLATLHPAESAMVGRYIILGVGALFIIIGNYMGKIRQNYFVGLRTPWSLADPVVWQKSQRFGGWAFVFGGLAIIGQSVFLGDNPWLFFGIILAMALLPIVYSYLIFKRKKTFPTLFAICFAVAFGIAVILRLVAGEDDWICRDGKWVSHGQPSTSAPTAECK